MTVLARRLLVAMVALALGGASAGLAACGTTKSRALIPSGDAGPLTDDLSRVGSAVDSGNCPAAQRALSAAQGDLDSLPGTTSKRLRTRIQQGIDTLTRQAANECQANETTTTTTTVPTTTATVPTTTTTTPTTPTTTTTTPTTTTTVPTPPTTPTTTPTTTDTTGTGGVGGDSSGGTGGGTP